MRTTSISIRELFLKALNQFPLPLSSTQKCQTHFYNDNTVVFTFCNVTFDLTQVISLSCFYFCINRMVLQPLILRQESRSRQWREPCPCNLKKQNKTQQKPNQTTKQAQTNLTSASSCFTHYSMKEQTQPIKALVLMGLEASLVP